MKRGLIKYVLVASLSFNIAFVGMGIYRGFIKKKNPSYGERQEYHFKLDQVKQKKLDGVIFEFKRALVDYRSDILDKRIEIIQELGDPEVSVDTLKKSFKELNSIENELNFTFLDTLIEISTILNQQQWLKFLYNLSENWFFSGMGS